jgi:hypothetical protein
VVSADSGVPIAQAQLTLARDSSAASPRYILEAVADEQGRFEVPALRPGSYRLLVRRPGYHARTVAVTVPREGVDTLVVRLDAAAVGRARFLDSLRRPTPVTPCRPWDETAQYLHDKLSRFIAYPHAAFEPFLDSLDLRRADAAPRIAFVLDRGQCAAVITALHDAARGGSASDAQQVYLFRLGASGFAALDPSLGGHWTPMFFLDARLRLRESILW